MAEQFHGKDDVKENVTRINRKKEIEEVKGLTRDSQLSVSEVEANNIMKVMGKIDGAS